jgi:hypothetical protein
MNWINGNGFIPGEGPSGAGEAWLTPDVAQGTFPAGSPGNTAYRAPLPDAIRPAWFGGTDAFGPYGSSGAGTSGGAFEGEGGAIAALFASFTSALNALIGRFGGAMQNGSTQSGSTRFANVTLGSAGDPHLSVSGTALAPGGATASVDSHFDSMTGHADLFSTNDFGDGFTVGTTVTAPSATGVTQNASATASMNGGLDSVTMTNAGAVSVTSGGMATALAPGQTIQLSGGESVSEAANGTVSIAERRFGESLTTTFTQNGGGGVDVSAQGTGVRLRGDLIAGQA